MLGVGQNGHKGHPGNTEERLNHFKCFLAPSVMCNVSRQDRQAGGRATVWHNRHEIIGKVHMDQIEVYQNGILSCWHFQLRLKLR